MLSDFVVEKLKGHSNPLPYDIFNEMVVAAALKFKFINSREASDAVMAELKKLGVEVGSQEFTLEHQYLGQAQAVPVGRQNPGFAWAPKKGSLLQVGDTVKVILDKGDTYGEGEVVNIGKNDSIEVLFNSGSRESFPSKLIHKMPKLDGRPIAPPQYRRVGDPYGLMDSPRDIGDPLAVRQYPPGSFYTPKGHEGESAAPLDDFYTSLISEIKVTSSHLVGQVEKYLAGDFINPTSELLSVLQQYGIRRAD